MLCHSSGRQEARSAPTSINALDVRSQRHRIPMHNRGRTRKTELAESGDLVHQMLADRYDPARGKILRLATSKDRVHMGLRAIDQLLEYAIAEVNRPRHSVPIQEVDQMQTPDPVQVPQEHDVR